MTKKDLYIPNSRDPNDPELPEVSSRAAHEQLLLSVTRLVREVAPDETLKLKFKYDLGFYDGPLSIALLFHRLALVYPDVRVFDRNFGYWAKAYMEAVPASDERVRKLTSPDQCGVIDENLARLAIFVMVEQNVEAAKELCSYKDKLLGDGGSDEWLYGRSGYLYLLRNSRHAFPDEPAYSEIRTLLTDTMNQVADRILEGAEANGGKWFWHGKEYSGPAHGCIGIITQIAMSCPSKRPQLEARLISLLHDQLESGNWKSSASSSHEDRLVQWCHGAPGFIPALITLKPLYPHLGPQIDMAIEKGRKCIWERGLLRKTPGLCHGISGNALALKPRQARHFLTYVTADVLVQHLSKGIFEQTEMPWGLFSGEAGRAWAWAVADIGEAHEKMWGMMIGFNDG